MKKLILMYLVIGTGLFFFGCSVDNPTTPEISQSDQVPVSLAPVSLAKAKPSPNLIGTTYALFNFPPLPDPGGSDLPMTGKGTITFGEETYGIYFLSHVEPRSYSQASPFYENFVIHEDGNEGNVYMKGWVAGVVTLANKVPDPVKFRSNGKITEVYGLFEMWQGCNVHSHGLVYWEFENGLPTGLPERAESTFRIN